MNDEHRARVASLMVDVDMRLSELWAMTWVADSVLDPLMEDDAMREAFGACLRSAYITGYRDALREDREGRRGELATNNGYAGI